MSKQQDYLVPVMSRKQRWEYLLLFSVWIICAVSYLVWWFDPQHIVTSSRFIVNSFVLIWILLLPGYFFYFLGKMKRSNPNIPIPESWRVAMVVTKAPSEPWSVVKETLLAMKKQARVHDNYLCDEHPSEEVLQWCRENDVKVSSRYGVSEYHRPVWPKRTKCKEGNLAYFYDMIGYENYDFVVQLDADHVPAAGYLEAMLRPFNDPRVGYVSSPSICDSNADNSWAARGRLFAEASMHGPLQAGYSSGWAPLCIGSHYAVRTSALRHSGGLGPELAEDHSTTLLFNAHNWKGVHAFDAEAHGDGPATFTDAMTQEFQWARSLVVLLTTLTPKVLGRMPIKIRLQFLFAQLWYPIFSVVMLISVGMPLIAIVTEKPWVNTDYGQFLLASAPVTLISILIVYWARNQGWMRPINVPILSWEVLIFQLARWPWVLWAVVTGLYSGIKNVNVDFKVTPKGTKQSEPVPTRTIIPYFVIGGISALTVLVGATSQSVHGYYYFAIENAVLYLLVTVVVIYRHLKEQYA